MQDILKSVSKHDLITLLASKAANNAIKGKFKVSLNTLEKISKHKLEKKLLQDLLLLAEKRNQFVHESSDEFVSNQAVEDGFDCIFKLIDELCEASVNDGIVLNDPIYQDT